MAKKLIVIEAPKKIPKFKEAVGTEYEVFASMGHCVDLPPEKLSIDIKNNFKPTYKVSAEKKSVVKEFCQKAKKADEIFFMTDEDREGEAIAWHLLNEIKDTVHAKIWRATTSEITKKGIKKALSSPKQIDEHKINAYETRRLLDRLCGYKTSFLTKQATGGKSAGRVQSAILRIMTDREQEILDFIPQEYWVLTAHLLSSKGEGYTGILDGLSALKIDNQKTAEEIYEKVVQGQPIVADVVSKEVSVKPYAPFVTSQLLMSSSTILGWNATKTMSVAQGLYEKAFITYHRTDAPFMAKEAVTDVCAFIDFNYGKSYLPQKPNVYTAKKGAQEAHECCRPTNIEMTPDNNHLTGDDASLYEIIWRRAVASQMIPGKDKRTKVITAIGGFDFVTKGNVILNDGFRKCWKYSKTTNEVLPDLQINEQCTLKSLEKEQKFTMPPPRYSDASIIKKCETEQIGRPATYASLLKVLQDRKYVAIKKKTFHPTDLGMKVVNFLKKADMCFINIKFTAEMEETLDKIQEGIANKSEVLSEFWNRLKNDIEQGKQVKHSQQETEFDCPKCGGTLLMKHSNYGPFFACQNYKKSKKGEDDTGCSFIATVGDHGEPVEKKQKKKEYADFECKQCGSKMIKRKSKYGEFAGCEKFPKCKATSDLDGNFKEPKKKWKKKWKKKS